MPNRHQKPPTTAPMTNVGRTGFAGANAPQREQAACSALKLPPSCLAEPFFVPEGDCSASSSVLGSAIVTVISVFRDLFRPTFPAQSWCADRAITTCRRDFDPGRRLIPHDVLGRSFRSAIPVSMGKWALVAFYDQENNRLRLRFPLRGPSVFSLDRGVCAPLQIPSGTSLIE